MNKKQRYEMNKTRLKVDIIDCPICKNSFIKISEYDNNSCICGSLYNIHLLGEIINFDIKDFTELNTYGKIKLNNNLKMRYGIRF